MSDDDDNNYSASDKEADIIDPEVNDDNNNELVADDDDDSDNQDMLIKSLYKARLGNLWDNLPTKLLHKQKTRNLLKHKGGPKKCNNSSK